MPDWTSFKPSALLALLALPLGLRAERAYRRLPVIPNEGESTSLHSLSIIVPARNEAHNLPALITSLKKLKYPGQLEILVVNDHSSDCTGEVAAAWGAQVLNLDQGLPAGWQGKPYACHQGALAAAGEWLLFTDADTIHSPMGLARAVAFAQAYHLDGLSLFIRQKTHRWWDHQALAAAFAGLFAGHHSRNHMLNGQFILIRRAAYLESGGFMAVRGEILEDVALGNFLHQQGYRLSLLRGEDIAEVQMYSSPRQMFHGLSRLGSDALRWGRAGSVLTALFITALMTPLIVLIGVLFRKLHWRWLPITWATSTVSLLPWTQRFGARRLALLAPIGALIVQTAAIYGLLRRLLGRGLVWKDRRV